jgi:hypothetical protein
MKSTMKRTMKRAGVISVVAAGVSCGPPANLLPVNDLNRPTDVVFMCFGAFPQGGADGGVDGGGTTAQLQVSGRPMGACHPQTAYDPGATTTTRTFAFMPNSAAGTLSAVDGDHWKLIDLNLQTGGYGTAPLGQDPEQISASDDGCRLISANRGSCDLTLVDPSVLVQQTFSGENSGNIVIDSPRAYGQTFRPIKGDGTALIAPPYEAVFLPQDTSGLLAYPTSNPGMTTSTPGATPLPLLPAQNALCGDTPAADTFGWPTQPGATKSWHVLVTYPSCDLVAVLELPSGKIVSSAKVVQNGTTAFLQDAGTSPVCPVSACAGQVLPAGVAASGVTDAAAGDGGPTHAAPGDAAADAGTPTGQGGSLGTTGAGGAAGGAGAAGAVGGGAAGAGPGGRGIDGGATGGTQGMGALNQYAAGPFFGTGPLGPSGIAILPDGTRAYIGLANASFVLSVGLSSSGLAVPGKGILLDEGARGTSRIRLNIDPNNPLNIDPNTHQAKNVFVGDTTGDRQYLYAIARDGTLRVIWLFHTGAETECETNIDPVHLPAGVSPSTSCVLPVGPTNRRPFSVGPGIHFPSLPVDVAAVDIAKNPPDTSEQSVNGAHAWVITDSGQVFLVNINPVLRQYTAVVPTTPPLTPPSPGTAVTFQSSLVTEATPFINTLRDRNQISYSLTLDTQSGPPRVDVLPTVPATGPYIEPFWTQGSALNATAATSSYLQTIAFFPQEPLTPDNQYDPIDRRAVTPQTWTVAWEGPLSGVRPTGKLLPGGDLSDFPGTIQATTIPIDGLFQDNGTNYCAMGVAEGDLVTLTGCTDNSQCGIGEQCTSGDSVSAAAGLSVSGICVDPNQASQKQTDCAEFLNSVRRYQVVAASPSNLVLRPNLDEIVLSPLLPPCHPARGSGADGGVTLDAGSSDGGTNEMDSCPDTANDPSTVNFKCVANDKLTGTAPRCLMPCNGSDAECRAGRVCVDFDSDPKNPHPLCSTHECFCADAPPLNGGLVGSAAKPCFDQLVNYQVNVGKSFLVAGSQSGIVNTEQLPKNGGACNPNPMSQGRFSFRIPMSAPVCTNVDSSIATIDSRINPDFVPSAVQGTAQTNAQKLVNVVTSSPQPFDPCLYLGGPVTSDPASDSTTLMPPNPDGGTGTNYTHVRALFQNAQLSFVLANLDRSPTTQLLISFDVHGGFGPQIVVDPSTVEVSMPARIIIGPVDSQPQVTTGIAIPNYEAPYLFVVDQRRLGREQGGGPTRGQLLRINPYGYTSTIGNATGYQPLFEDYNVSGGLFPIQ